MEPQTVPHEQSHDLADDLLRGADEIAAFIFGSKANRRKVYYLAECSRLPVFRLGARLCARRTVLLKWIAGQESRVLCEDHAVSAACLPSGKTHQHGATD